MTDLARRWLKVLDNQSAFAILEALHDMVEVESLREIERRTNIHHHAIKRYIAGGRRVRAILTRLVLNYPIRRCKKTPIRITPYGCLLYHILHTAPDKARQLVEELAEFAKLKSQQKTNTFILPEGGDFKEPLKAMLKCVRCKEALSTVRVRYYPITPERVTKPVTDAVTGTPTGTPLAQHWHKTGTPLAHNWHTTGTPSPSSSSSSYLHLQSSISSETELDKTRLRKENINGLIGKLSDKEFRGWNQCAKCGKDSWDIKVFKVEEQRDLELDDEFKRYHMRFLCPKCYTEVAKKYWAMKAGEAGWRQKQE